MNPATLIMLMLASGREEFDERMLLLLSLAMSAQGQAGQLFGATAPYPGPPAPPLPPAPVPVPAPYGFGTSFDPTTLVLLMGLGGDLFRRRRRGHVCEEPEEFEEREAQLEHQASDRRRTRGREATEETK